MHMGIATVRQSKLGDQGTKYDQVLQPFASHLQGDLGIITGLEKQKITERTIVKYYKLRQSMTK
jgi:hypothetical protein